MPTPVTDTPEVRAARAKFLATFRAEIASHNAAPKLSHPTHHISHSPSQPVLPVTPFLPRSVNPNTYAQAHHR